MHRQSKAETTPAVPARRLSTASMLLAFCLWAVGAQGGDFLEDFLTDPSPRGWRILGDAQLFKWDAATGNVAVTWDSAQPNSYFHLPLGQALTRNDDFEFALDLRLTDIRIGLTTNKPYSFQVALGWLNLAEAGSPGFLRGTGVNSPDVVELNYFPDSGFGPSISPVAIGTDGTFAYAPFTVGVDFKAGRQYRVHFRNHASAGRMEVNLTEDGQPGPEILSVAFPTNFTDFRVDAFSISSFSDTGSDGSILAHGIVDNVRITVPGPAPVLLRFTGTGSGGAVTFASRIGTKYALESSEDLVEWSGLLGGVAGSGGDLTLSDPLDAIFSHRFYRVRAE